MTIGNLASAVGRGLLAGAIGTVAMAVSSTLETKLRDRAGSSAPADAASKVLGVKSVDAAAEARFGTLVHWGYGTGWGAVRGLLGGIGLGGLSRRRQHRLPPARSGRTGRGQWLGAQPGRTQLPASRRRRSCTAQRARFVPAGAKLGAAGRRRRNGNTRGQQPGEAGQLPGGDSSRGATQQDQQPVALVPAVERRRAVPGWAAAADVPDPGTGHGEHPEARQPQPPRCVGVLVVAAAPRWCLGRTRCG